MTSDRIRVQSDVRELTDRVKNLDIRVTKNHRELKLEFLQLKEVYTDKYKTPPIWELSRDDFPSTL